MNDISRRARCATLVRTACAMYIACHVSAVPAADWVAAGMSTEGDARVELSTSFSKKKGRFAAVPESLIENRQSIQGEFIVGRYRYVYKTPQVENGLRVDEAVFTELMDCENQYYGTLLRTKRFRGKAVRTQRVPDAQLSMVQTSGPTTVDAKLCALHAGRSPADAGPHQGANPDYHPGASNEEQVDALIDQYAPPAVKK